MQAVCLSFLLFIAAVSGAGIACTEDSQCGTGECCQIMSEFMVVSKRDLVTKLPTLIKPTRKGTCESYSPEGSSCRRFDKVNGYCSCEPGTFCKQFEVPISTQDDQTSRKTRKIVAPKEGYTWKLICTRS